MESAERLERALLSLDGLSVGDAFGKRFFVHPSGLRLLLGERALPAPPHRPPRLTPGRAAPRTRQMLPFVLAHRLAQARAHRLTARVHHRLFHLADPHLRL